MSASKAVRPLPAAMRLAEPSTVRTERAIRSRISASRLNALMMRAPSTVSLIVCMIWVEPWKERLAKRFTLVMILRMKKTRIGSAQIAPAATSGS